MATMNRDGLLALYQYNAYANHFVHSIHHRAEMGILLGQMGHSLPTLDIIIHFMHQSGQPWK